MEDFINVLTTRRSCKSFIKGKRISDCDIDKILQAGVYAPTGKGMQSPTIVLVNDDETVAKLSKLNAQILGAKVDPFYGAPTVAIVFADKDFFTYLYDGSLIMGNMLNAIHSLGYGGCWIHRAKEMFETEEGKALKKKWGLKDSMEGIGNCVMGYPTGEWRESKPRKDDYIIKV